MVLIIAHLRHLPWVRRSRFPCSEKKKIKFANSVQTPSFLTHFWQNSNLTINKNDLLMDMDNSFHRALHTQFIQGGRNIFHFWAQNKLNIFFLIDWTVRFPKMFSFQTLTWTMTALDDSQVLESCTFWVNLDSSVKTKAPMEQELFVLNGFCFSFPGVC